MVLLGRNSFEIKYSFFVYLISMKIKGSMWTACGLSVFQLLSEDYISYIFFILFVGMAIGAVQVITVPYVLEMVKQNAQIQMIFNLNNRFMFSFQLNLELSMVYY